MLESTFDLRLSEPDIDLIGKLTIAENLFLAMVAVIAALNILGGWCPRRGACSGPVGVR